MVETAKYDVLREEGDFEIRRYHEMIVASVEDPNGSQFRVLFNYISGANRSKQKINMTSPVISSEKIAMTSPVINSTDSMSFVVPEKYNMETVPEPTDERVTLNKIPERHVATVRFSGFAWKNSVNKQTKRLLDWVTGEELEMKGKPFLMQYNAPYVPGFLRRNEIGVEIEY